MSFEEKEEYLKKLERDYDCNADIIEDEIEANVSMINDPDELAEWSVALWNRCNAMRDLNGVYGKWAERVEECS